MRFLLDAVYLGLALMAAPFLLYRRLRFGKYRHGWSAKLLGRVPIPPRGGGIWFHAVSVGEINVLVPLVRVLRQQWPDRPFVISTTSQTGYELALQRFPQDTVAFAPLDFSWAARQALDRWQPELLVLVELELWPNLIWEAHRRGVRIAIVNGRISERSFLGYRRIRPLIARVVRCIDLIAAQNPQYADRFRRLGARESAVFVTGSTKFDQAKTDRDNIESRRLRDLAGLTTEHLVFIAGSTQAPEEEYALQVFRDCRAACPGMRLLLVPRHRERFDEVAAQLQRSGLAFARRTTLTPGAATNGNPDPVDVLLVDTIGELSDWWAVADMAFVGGSFGSRGGQNMLEPAAYGVPTCFGPHTENFREISLALIERRAARVVHSVDELREFVLQCARSEPLRRELGQRAREFVLAHQGAVRRTCELLRGLLDAAPETNATRAPRPTAISISVD